jgi:hypothetical protein
MIAYIFYSLFILAAFTFILIIKPSLFTCAIAVFVFTVVSWSFLLILRCKAINRSKPLLSHKEWYLFAVGNLLGGLLFLISILMGEGVSFGVIWAYISVSKGLIFLVIAKRAQTLEGKATLF